MDWQSLYLLELILVRMAGFMLLNPLFGRGTIPGLVKLGFAGVLALFTFSYVPGLAPPALPATVLEFSLHLLLELAVGFVLGFVMRLFFSVVQFGGEIIDTQMGMTMSQIYDASSQANLTLTGSLLNILLVLNFFAANGHYTLLRMLTLSGTVLPFGQAALADGVAPYMAELFFTCMVLAVKLGLPILAAELLSEVGMGILMKAIPQINAFVINIELKVIVGLVLLLVFLYPMNEFVLGVEQEMLQSLERALGILAGAG